MKRIISKFSMLLIVCLFALSLSSCKHNKIDDTDDNHNNNDEPKTEIIKSEEELKASLGNEFYFEIETNLENGETSNNNFLEIIASNATNSYAQTQGFGIIMTHKEGSRWVTYNGIDGKLYLNNESDNNEAQENIDTLLNTHILMVTGDISYTSKKSVTILGRSATEYVEETSSSNAAMASSTKYTYVIDNKTGLCLKHSIEIYTKVDGVEERYKSTTEVKKMILGDSSKINEFFTEKMANIVTE